jgi:hypothetical protein
VASELLLVVRFVVLRFFKPPRFVDGFLVVVEVRPSGFDRLDLRFLRLLDDRVSAESASPPITDPAVVPCSVEKLNSLFFLRDFGAVTAFLVARPLIGRAFEVDGLEVDVLEVEVLEVVPLATPFRGVPVFAVPERGLPERGLPERWELRLPRPRVADSSAAASVAVQSFSTSCEVTTR